jgi:hypothetical protein
MNVQNITTLHMSHYFILGMYDIMMKDIFGSKPLCQSPHIKKMHESFGQQLQIDMFNTKRCINLNEDITK